MLKLVGEDYPGFALYEYGAGDVWEPVPSEVLKLLGCPAEGYSEVRSGSPAVSFPNPPKPGYSGCSDVWVYMWLRDGRRVYAHFWNKVEVQGFGAGIWHDWRGCAILAPVELTPEQVLDCGQALRASGDPQYVEEGWEYEMRRF